MGDDVPVTAHDLLATIYRSPGPYCSVYLNTATDPLGPTHGGGGWSELRNRLVEQGAPPKALEAIDARLGLPAPDDTAAVAVLAAADGTTVVDHGAEPPRQDVAVVGTLPYAAPLLEWDQRRVAHVVVTVNADGADVVSFGADHREHLLADLPSPATARDDVVTAVVEQAADVSARLVVVIGDERHSAGLSEALVNALPADCRVVTEPATRRVDDAVDAVVRHVTDVSARATVAVLREHRFLEAHDAAVDGSSDTVEALRTGSADVLLIHDDPRDERRAWVGRLPGDISLESDTRDGEPARFVDAAIRSAVLQGIDVHIIPSTGSDGPEDDAAAITHR